MRKYLTSQEVNELLIAASHGQYGARNYCMFLMSYIHGFRVSEMLRLKISDIDLATNTIHVSRLKNGFSTVHPLQPREITALNKWLAIREQWLLGASDYLFFSKKCTPLTRQFVHSLAQRLGENAGINVRVHPHMLRHSCGYALAESGKDTRLIQDYLGHRSIQHTVRYTASNAKRFQTIEI